VRLNGEPTEYISALDRGLQYGDGLFETFAVVGGRPALWSRHIDRLIRGCARLGIPPPSRNWLWEQAESEIDEAPSDPAVLKIIITRGSGGRGYRPTANPSPSALLHLSPWPDYPPEWSEQGVRTRICSTPVATSPATAGLKSLNRLEQVLARAEWDAPEIAEGIMLDYEGRVIEGATTNLFLWQGETLVTPDLAQSGVAGIMRGLVLECAVRLGIPVRIERIYVDDLWEADSLFLTNSLIGIWPVREVEGRSFNPDAGDPRLRELVRSLAFDI